MSAADDGPGTREVARRLFAAEYDDASLSYSESDEERAPNYVVTPTGARINRMFVAGVFTEVEQVNEEMLRARIVDPTGAFVSYAGQYQPDALAFFERTDPPEFVAVTGKARTFQPEDSDRVFTSVRPESVNAVDADTRDRWAVSAAESTLRRVAAFDAALESGLSGEELGDYLREAGVDESVATGVPLAIDHYATTRAYLEAVRRLAVDVLEVVAGEREEVRALDLAPDEGGDVDLGPIPEAYAVEGGAVSAAATAGDEGTATGSPAADGTPSTAASTSTDEATTAEADPVDAEAASTDAEAASTDAEAASADAESPTDTPSTASGADDATRGAEAASVDAEATESGDADAETEPGDGAETSDAAAVDSPDDSGELGDFGVSDEDGDVSDDGDEATDLDEEGMYELDEEERREVEEEYGVEFSSGSEVGEPGEADIETPAPTDVTAETEPEEPGEGTETVAAEAEEPVAGTTDDADQDASPAAAPDEPAEAASEEAAGDDEGSADVDLESVAVEKMAELDEGDGAQREAVVAAVVDEYGADPGAVDDAIQDALMDGRCYEPGDDRLKSI